MKLLRYAFIAATCIPSLAFCMEEGGKEAISITSSESSDEETKSIIALEFKTKQEDEAIYVSKAATQENIAALWEVLAKKQSPRSVFVSFHHGHISKKHKFSSGALSKKTFIQTITKLMEQK